MRKERKREEKRREKKKMGESEGEERGKGCLLGRPLFLIAIFDYFCNCWGFRGIKMGKVPSDHISLHVAGY